MLRRLRVLAAFFMVPVVLLSNPSTAAAAGPWQQIHIAMDVLGSNDWVGRQCTFNARNTGSAVEVGSSGWCSGLPDSSPGGLQPGEAGSSFTLTFDGANGSGASCGATYAGTLGQHSANGTVRVAGSIPSGSATITGGQVGDLTCVITEVCVRLMDSEFVCGSFTLEPGTEEEPTASGCVHGTPHAKLVYRTRPYEPNPTSLIWDEVWLVTSRAGAPMSTVTWGAAVRWGGPGSEVIRDVTTTSEVKIREQLRSITSPPYQYPASTGIEMWTYPDPHPTLKWNLAPATNYYNPAQVPSTPPDSVQSAFHGITDPEHCRFYFGPKQVNFSNTDIDEPFIDNVGSEVPPPPVEEPEPPVTEPPPVVEPPDDMSWLGMIWAVLQSIWGTMKSVLAAIKGLVSGIVNGIVDGVRDMLDGLFVPEAGYLEGKWAGVENKWAGTSPGKYMGTLVNFQPTGVSGCGGVPLNVTLPGDVQINQNIGEACSGRMSTAAGVVNTALVAVFGVGGAIACVRAVGAGIGWSPSMKGGVS